MVNSSTYMDEQQIDTIIKISGQEIRSFLDFLCGKDQKSDYCQLSDWRNVIEALDPYWKDVVSDYIKNPQLYTDMSLVSKGSQEETAIRYAARIEVRRTEGVDGAAQIAAKGVAGEFRSVVIKKIKSLPGYQNKFFDAKLSGTSSFEFNVPGVNKSLSISYAAKHWDALLDAASYTAGPFIDARKTRTLVAADGDGTTYGRPVLDELPSLRESEACKMLIEYLQNGGIYMILSGNDLNRTIKRVDDAIPDRYKKQFFIAANGCADMAVFAEGEGFSILEGYRLNALNSVLSADETMPLDVIYIGDDGRIDGNDFDAFNEVGFDRSFYVGDDPVDKVFPSLLQNHVGGREIGTYKVLQAVNNLARNSAGKALFSEQNILNIMHQAG